MARPNTFQLFVRDIVVEILHRLREAKKTARARVPGSVDRSFEEGRALAFYEVLSHMKNKTVGFGIPLTALGFDGIDLEKELTSPPQTP